MQFHTYRLSIHRPQEDFADWGFELSTTGIRSDHSANFATTTALLKTNKRTIVEEESFDDQSLLFYVKRSFFKEKILAKSLISYDDGTAELYLKILKLFLMLRLKAKKNRP